MSDFSVINNVVEDRGFNSGDSRDDSLVVMGVGIILIVILIGEVILEVVNGSRNDSGPHGSSKCFDSDSS